MRFSLFWSALNSQAFPDEASDVPEFPTADLEFFEKQIRPILADRCWECHRASGAPKGGLRLESRESMLAGGDTGPAIVPKNPQSSLLIDAINYGDTYQMPPKNRLPPDEIALLTKWVEIGTPWPKQKSRPIGKKTDFDLEERKSRQWAWKPIQQPALPAFDRSETPQRRADVFIRAKLLAEGLECAPPADHRTLSRRLHFDLVGLPPAADLDIGTMGGEPDAWDRLVDSLLANPRFGERWARHWMDLMRYAETCGHEFDYPIRNAWFYRDYLIRAFNGDLPYDRFIEEHIAGDLLSDPAAPSDRSIQRIDPRDDFLVFG